MKVCIYWDSENVHATSDLSTKLIEFVTLKKDHVISQMIYTNSSGRNFAKWSLESDFQQIVKIVDVASPLKNAVDNQLKSDVIDDIYSNNSPDIFIVVSGDGDFANLVKIIRDKGKYVIIFARQGNAKKSLKDIADEFYFIDNLHKLVEEKTQSQITNIQTQISYHEAVEYLINAIKTSIINEKRTTLGYINKLMGHIYPQYQNISSISTPNGKKIKTFTHFVDMVVKEGKVKKQNQELFLIELNQIAA